MTQEKALLTISCTKNENLSRKQYTRDYLDYKFHYIIYKIEKGGQYSAVLEFQKMFILCFHQTINLDLITIIQSNHFTE